MYIKSEINKQLQFYMTKFYCNYIFHLLFSFNTCAAYIINIMEYLEPNQFDSLLSSGERALVMFYADWCIFVKDSNQFLSLLLLQSLRAMVTNSMNLRLMMMITHYGTGSQLVLFLHYLLLIKARSFSRRDAKIGVG